MKRIFLIAITTVIAVTIWASFSQDTVDDLPGDFKEMAFFRNENNTGPIIRKYAVSLKDTLWQEMKQHGQIMPYTKYGTTTVFYFLHGSDIPKKLELTSPSFNPKYQPYCVGRFERNATGVTSFKRFPFRSEIHSIVQ